MIRYTPRTVSYAKELTSVYICYSQGNGFDTPLSIFYILYTLCSSVFSSVGVPYRPTSGAGNKYYVCTTFVNPTCNSSARLVKLYSKYVCDFCFCFVLFCLASLLLFLGVFLPVIYRRGVRYSRCPSLRLLPLSLFDLIAIPLSLLLFILFRCPPPCFVFLSGLSCTIYICIWLPFLPYAYYMWLPWFVLFLFFVFFPF